MNYILSLILLTMSINAMLLFDFTTESNLQHWKVTDDTVMGGKSSSLFSVTEEGFGLFSGKVSLENNGGFSSVRYRFDKMDIKGCHKIILKVRGDGKIYQFRVKSSSENYYSYITTFSTTGEWQEIEISLADMYPSFRGQKLDQANFEDSYIEEIGFLIGNKEAEDFKLLIDKIVLQ